MMRHSKVEEKLLQREQSYILTENDRQKIRQTLSKFSKKKQEEEPDKGEQLEKSTDIPHISEISTYDEFQWINYKEPLDEVPYLFLFRIHLFPYIHYKKHLSLKDIQELCVMSGMSNFTLKEVNEKTTRLSGDIDRGGMIKGAILYMIAVDGDKHFINKCIFKSMKRH